MNVHGFTSNLIRSVSRAFNSWTYMLPQSEILYVILALLQIQRHLKPEEYAKLQKTDKETENFREFRKALEHDEGGTTSIQVTDEIDLLSEVKDIQDELNMMRTVFKQQNVVLKKLHSIIPPKRLPRSDSVISMETYKSDQHHPAVEWILNKINEEDTDGGRAAAQVRLAQMQRRSNSIISMETNKSDQHHHPTVDWIIKKIDEMDADAKRAAAAVIKPETHWKYQANRLDSKPVGSETEAGKCGGSNQNSLFK
jgi:hypothetical protein